MSEKLTRVHSWYTFLLITTYPIFLVFRNYPGIIWPIMRLLRGHEAPQSHNTRRPGQRGCRNWLCSSLVRFNSYYWWCAIFKVIVTEIWCNKLKRRNLLMRTLEINRNINMSLVKVRSKNVQCLVGGPPYVLSLHLYLCKRYANKWKYKYCG